MKIDKTISKLTGQRPVFVEPLGDGFVLLRIHVHLNRLQRLNVQNVVGEIQRRLLVVERGKTHPESGGGRGRRKKMKEEEEGGGRR